MSLELQASESITLEQALERLEASEGHVREIMHRLEPICDLAPGSRILDVGAAQGRNLVALTRLGFDAVGVEPWAAARETGARLGEALGMPLDLREGTAEAIPLADDEVDAVIATSVIEHVRDIEATLREIRRVLKPGGVFWFNSASAMSPRQNEIRGFPGFGWYPDPVKVGLMHWARDHRPELIGYTTAPALHWWTDAKAERLLRRAGFTEIWNRWELRRVDRETGLRRATISTVRRSGILRRVADAVVGGCSYAAR